jgi:hypothetical protein
MRGEPILQVALTLLKYGRASELEAVLRSLFEVLSQGLTTERAKNLLDTIRIYVMSVNPVVGEEKMSELVSEFWPVQPEPGSVADQLIKKGEARGEARGEVRGEARGKTSASIKTIRILQSILGVTESSDEELAGKDLADLEAKIETLRNQIGSRPSGE